MATILAGDIDFKANVAGRFGHHVATTDSTRAHISDARPVSSMDMSINNFATHIGPVSHRHPQYLDYSQYNIVSNQYVAPGYLLNPHDTIVTDSKFNQPMTVGGIARVGLSGVPDTNHRFYFDFADYIGLTGTATLTGTVTHKEGGVVNFRFYDVDAGTGGADTFSISSGTQDLSVTFPIASTGLDYGFLNVNMEALGSIIDVNGVDVRGSAEVSDLRCSIAVTGRTRINTSNVYVNTFTELNDLVGTGSGATRDSALRFENWDRGSVIGGNPVVHGVVASFGVLDLLYPDNLSSTEDPVGRFAVQYDKPIQDDSIPATTSLVIRKDNADVLSAPIPNITSFSFGLGGAATSSFDNSAFTDLPAISHFIALNDGSLSLADTTDIDIELRYIDPAFDSTDVRPDDDGYQDGFVQARLLLNPPFIAEDIETKSTFTVSELYYIDANFTSTFVGGILQLGTASVTSEFELTPLASGSGVIIDGGTVNTTVNFGINDIYQLDTRFTANFVGNQRHQPTVDIAFNLAQSLIASETGIIIANEKTTTFNWDLTVDSVVFVTPDRYRELLLKPQTRTYAVTEEKRDFAVNTESRSYPVQQEQRSRTVVTETRTITEKGYSS